MDDIIFQSQKADIETSGDDYARRFSGKVGEYFLNVQADTTLELLKKWSNASILDVGGGHAQLTVPLVKNNYKVTVAGSDETCRIRLDKLLKPSSFQFEVCNLLNLPYEDNSFDIVLSFRLLTHEENWQRQLAELCRVAKQAVIIDYPDIRSFNIFYKIMFKIKKKYEGNTRNFKSFKRKELLNEFYINDFFYPEFKPEFFLPMVFHRLLKNVPLSMNIEKIFRTIGLTYFLGSPVILKVESKN